MTKTASDFSISSVIGRTFTTLCKNPVVLLGLSFIFLIPIVGVTVLTRTWWGIPRLLALLIRTVLITSGQGAISYATLRILRGERASIGEALSRTISHIWPLVGTALLMNLGTGLGFLLFVIPGVILLCMWTVAIPACVIEHLETGKGLKRSETLTKGYRWKIFGVGILSLVAFLIMLRGIPHIMGLFPLSSAGLTASIVAVLLVLLFMIAFYCILPPIIYYNLRETKEGVSVDSLANVFD